MTPNEFEHLIRHAQANPRRFDAILRGLLKRATPAQRAQFDDTITRMKRAFAQARTNLDLHARIDSVHERLDAMHQEIDAIVASGGEPCDDCGQFHLGGCASPEEIADFDRSQGMTP
jgi:hypothetical protein